VHVPALAAPLRTRLQGLTLAPISAQLELTLPLSAQLSLLVPHVTRMKPWVCPKGTQVELERERCVPKVLKLSFEVSECKPLPVLSLAIVNQSLSLALLDCTYPISAWYQGLTLVDVSAQLEHLLDTASGLRWITCGQRQLKLSGNGNTRRR
jgi:hypothetical protein